MDLRLNTAVDAEDRLQQLLARKAEIDAQNAHIQAEITALLPPSAPPSYQQPPRSPIHKHRHHRSVGVSRSMSSSGATMARQHSDLSGAPAPRQRTLSQRSAPAPSMARTNSRGASSASTVNLGFTQSASNRPPFPPESQESLTMDTWMRDQSMNPYAFSQQPSGSQRSASQRGCVLEQVNELDVGEDPGEFISRTVGPPALAFSEYSPSTAMLNNNHLSADSFYSGVPTTPTTDTLTIATTLQSSSSQQSSICHEPVLDSFQMMKVNSNASHFTDLNSTDHMMFDHANTSFPSFQTRRSSSEEQKHLLAGLGGASHDSQFSPPFLSPDAFVPPSFGEKMEKSQSSESTSSTSSRSKQRLLATVAAARPLKPRGGGDENDMSRTSSSRAGNRLKSDGPHDKVAISKPTYQRPRHDRVFCKQCESYPDGFRGEHELRRHQDREHKSMVKKWVCIESNSQPKPIVPLSKCKACCQKKRYGAYYNAAAHLRRTHFKPKAKARTKTVKGGGGEKRAGKGGGDWPRMAELKLWMEEVEEQATEYPTTSSQEDDVDDSDDEVLQNNFDDHVLPEQVSSGNNFDESFLAGASPIPSIFASSNNDVFVSNDLASEQGSFADSSMYSHNSFSHFSPSFSNDPMAFFDSSLSQAFDDQASAGLDFTSVNFSYQ